MFHFRPVKKFKISRQHVPFLRELKIRQKDHAYTYMHIEDMFGVLR